MTGLQLISSLIIYILSIAGTLILAITTKRNGRFPLKTLLIIHFAFLVLFMIAQFTGFWGTTIHYLFLLFVCSGMLMSAAVFNKQLPVMIRFYPLLHLLSVLFFVFSPSLTIRFITFNWHQDHKGSWNIYSNYFFEEEKGMLETPAEQSSYKVTRHFGIFHKTLARNISFNARLDSVKVLRFEEDNGLEVRGYFVKKYPTFEACDSTDISVPFVAAKNTIIQKRKKL